MTTQNWECLKTPQEKRYIQIQERAFYLSTHQQAESRPADPTRDWLVAEWIEANYTLYWELTARIHGTINDIEIVCGIPKDEYCNNLRSRGRDTAISLLKTRMGTITNLLKLNLDWIAAIDRSETYNGLVYELVDQLRQK
jgi:hypothetical protein